MVQERDADDSARRFELLGYLNIGGGRLKAAGGVIVGNDDAGGTICHSIGKNFARMHRGWGRRSKCASPDHLDGTMWAASGLLPTVPGSTLVVPTIRPLIVGDLVITVRVGEDMLDGVRFGFEGPVEVGKSNYFPFSDEVLSRSRPNSLLSEE